LVEGPGGWEEYFVSFRDYPVFERATVEQICAMEQTGPNHLHWAELDEDIEIDALCYPEKYPLIYKH
jgi:hypothetical protein